MSKTKHPANMVILTGSEQFVHISALLFTQADDYLLQLKNMSESLYQDLTVTKWLSTVIRITIYFPESSTFVLNAVNDKL